MKRDYVKILIADRDPQTAQKLFDALKQAGYQPKMLSDSSNPSEAIKTAVREQTYDFLFLDAAIGSNNGEYLAFGTELQKMSPKTKIILMLNKIDQRPESKSNRATNFRFLLKPIEHERNVIRLIETCLEPTLPNNGLLLAKIFSEFVSTTSNLTDILQKLVDDVVKNLGYEICAVILRREDDPQSLYIAAACGISREHQKNFNLREGEGITGNVVATGLAKAVSNILGEEDYRYPQFAIKENLCSMVCISLCHNQRILGALNVYTGTGYFHEFSQDEINLLSMLANWTAWAIQNAEKYATKEREQKILIEEIIRETQSFDSLKKMIKSVLHKSAALVGGDAGYIAFVDFERMRFRPVFGYLRKVNTLKKLKIGSEDEGITGHVVQCGESKIVDNVHKDPQYRGKADNKTQSKILVPLKYQNQVIGVLGIESEKEAYFKEDDKRILAVLATQLALILHKKIIDQAFRKLGYSFRTTYDVNEIYDTVIRCAKEVTRTNAIAIWEKDIDRNFTIRACLGLEESQTQNIKIHSDRGIISQVIAKRDFVLVEDVKENKTYNYPELIANTQLKWLLCIPMFFGGEVFGVIDIYSRRPYGFLEQEIDYLKALAGQASVALQNARLINHFNRIGQSITSSQGIKKILEHIAQSAVEVLYAEPVILFQYDQVANRLVPPPIYAGILLEKSGYVETFKFSGHSFAELIVKHGESLYIDIEQDIDQHPLMVEARKHIVEGMSERRFHEREKTKSMAALILRVEDEVVGLMFLNYRTPQKFSPIEKKIMETFASHAAIAIKNSRLIEQLRNNEEALKSIFDGIPDPIIVTENRIENVGPNWKIGYANREVHEMFGYNFGSRELVGKNARELFGNQLSRLREALHETNGEISNFETSFLHKAGYPIPISLSTSILQKDETNRIIKTIGIAKDLTNRKKLEKQLEHLNQATISLLNAETLEQAFDIVFENLRQIGYDKGMISLVDETSNTIVAKRAVGENWKKILELTKIDLKSDNVLAMVVKNGKPRLIEDCVTDPHCDPIRVQLANLKSKYVVPLIMQDKVIGTLQIDFSDKQDLLKGDKYFLQESLKVLSGFANQIAVAIEVNRRKITIDKLRRTLADVGHEFRSPLHIIISQLGGLKYHLDKKYDEDEFVKKTAKIIEEEAFRAERQMKNTWFSTVESLEAMGVNFEKGYIIDTIRLCADRFRETAAKRGIIIIVYDSVKRLPLIHYDKIQLEQVFTNLLDNAVKYSHDNQNIEIRGMEKGRKLEISIMDRGLGIPEDHYELIFQGFTRSKFLDTTRFIPGTGLGLMIAKEIVERHKGKIKVKSFPFLNDQKRLLLYDGYETTFYVVLPEDPREV